MAYQVHWLETDARFGVADGESVLDAALRNAVPLPHDCRLGGCATCRVRVLQGEVAYDDGELPFALQPEDHAAGFALACQARPRSDLVLSAEPAGADCSELRELDAEVSGLARLAPDVVHLRLALPAGVDLRYRPGQYMNLLLGDGRRRSFSMASAPTPSGTGEVDFHVRVIPNGRFTAGTLPTLAAGDRLRVEIPHGSFRLHREDDRPLLMMATGTGLAPIRAMLESLLDDPDCPPVALYWGTRTETDLYLHQELQSWAGRLYDWRYVPVLSRADAGWSGRRGHVQAAALADIDDLADRAVYLCGSPLMVADAQTALLAAGASAEHLYADSFTFQAA